MRTSRANRKAKSASIMRTRGAQIGTHQEIIDVQLDGLSDGQRIWLEGMRVDGKVKGTKVRDL